ncbi:MAG TPA: efflux transporter outer membrane subunit [Rhizomicrobium sp.]|jgi:NodT family efflux transporter outer membrane factor (OMF) lipoprotein
MNKRYSRIALIAFAGTLAGCTVGPDFVKPSPVVPPAWTAGAANPAGKVPSALTSSAPETDAWWQSFRDPELVSLISRAATENLDLREAALRIAEARAQRDISAADQLPSVSGNASYTNQRISTTTAQGSLFGSFGKLGGGLPVNIPSFPNPYNQYQIGFDASWEPDVFGGVRRSVEAAGADVEASQEDARAALISLEAEIARDYIDLRNAQGQLAITNRDLVTEQQIRLLARQRHDAGLGTDLDVVNATAELRQTQSQLPPLSRTIESDINQLSQLLAREPGALGTELRASAPVPPVPAKIRIGLPGDLVRRRPDIRGAEARLHGATARVGVAVATLFPSLTFNANLGTQAERFPDLAEWASRFYSIGPSLQIPIFEGGRLRATVQLADLKEKEAALDYANTVLNAVHEVENAIVAYDSEQRRRAALGATLIQNRDALGLARDRYKSGLTTFLDVLDAERNARQTELAMAASTAAVSTNLVALYKALGGGWEENGDTGGHVAQNIGR